MPRTNDVHDDYDLLAISDVCSAILKRILPTAAVDSCEGLKVATMALKNLAHQLGESLRPKVEDSDRLEAYRCRVALIDAIPNTNPQELNEALDVLAEYISAHRIEDANSMANAAYVGGIMIQAGADPKRLNVLLGKLPFILRAARGYADGILPHLLANNADTTDILVKIDGQNIPAGILYVHAEQDEGGLMCLEQLYKWILPSVVLLTHDRGLLQAACDNVELRQALYPMMASDAEYLDMLLWGEFDQIWLVLYPSVKRAFHVRVDGVVTNRATFALIADALVLQAGIPGERNAEDVLAYLRGEKPSCHTDTAFCPFPFYNFKATKDILANVDPPEDSKVSSGGWPIDIPTFQGRKTLVLGPQPSKRPAENSWLAGYTFYSTYDPHLMGRGEPGIRPFQSPYQRLRPQVHIVHEVAAEEACQIFNELSTAKAFNEASANE